MATTTTTTTNRDSAITTTTAVAVTATADDDVVNDDEDFISIVQQEQQEQQEQQQQEQEQQQEVMNELHHVQFQPIPSIEEVPTDETSGTIMNNTNNNMNSNTYIGTSIEKSQELQQQQQQQQQHPLPPPSCTSTILFHDREGDRISSPSSPSTSSSLRKTRTRIATATTTRPTATSGFRSLLEKAIEEIPTNTNNTNTNNTNTNYSSSSSHSRSSTNDTITNYMIDYWRFKKRLQYFARRRCHILHTMINHNHNTTTTAITSSSRTSTKTTNDNDYYKYDEEQQLQSSMMSYNNNNNYTTTTTTNYINMDQMDIEDIYTHFPLSYNLSMDPHAHIGRGSGGIVVPSTEDSCGTIGMMGTIINNNSNNNTYTNMSATTTTTTTDTTNDYIEMKDDDHHYHHNDDGVVNHDTTESQSSHVSKTTTSFEQQHPSVSKSNSHHSNQPIKQQQQQQVIHSSLPLPTQPLFTTTTPTTTTPTPKTTIVVPIQRRSTIMRKLSISERNEIITFLEWEMDQCYMYYLLQYNQLSLQFYNNNNNNTNNSNNNNINIKSNTSTATTTGVTMVTPNDDQNSHHHNNNNNNMISIIANMIQLGDHIIDLICYCTINIIITQQILIRYDALALSLEGTPMLHYYMKKVYIHYQNNNNNSNSIVVSTDSNNNNNNNNAHNNNNINQSNNKTKTSSYYKVRYHKELITLANQFITMIISSSPAHWTFNNTNNNTNEHDSTTTMTAAMEYTIRTYITHFQEQMDMFRTLLDSLQSETVLLPPPSSSTSLSSSSVSVASTISSSHPYTKKKSILDRIYDTIMKYSIKKYIQMGLFEDQLGLEPTYLLSNRGQSLIKEMKCIVQWKQEKIYWYNTFYNNNKNINNQDHNTMYYYNYYNPMYHNQQQDTWYGSKLISKSQLHVVTNTNVTTTIHPPPDYETNTLHSYEKEEKKLSGLQIFHLTLNMMAGFLYCMNYYIVEPSSTMYVNRLGAHDAMSGTLIGMMPLAAFISSIPYSMWTNRSFRHPFIMSSIMLILGNILYSFADQFGVVWIALLGRFMAGLGAPKCIIRRYMADTTPVSLRTSVNAGFGMVVAAGSAMGPAMAIMLNRIEYTCFVKHVGLVTLNGLTLPGYFMACLWFTFFIIVLLTFEEPDREGLKEQKELEARGGIPFSPSNMGSFGDGTNGIPANDIDGIFRENNTNNKSTIETTRKDDELYSVFSGESCNGDDTQHLPSVSTIVGKNNETIILGTTTSIPIGTTTSGIESYLPNWIVRIIRFSDLITLPVRICLFLLFCKVFTIEALVSSTSALTKNRYKWQVTQVGRLGFANGVLVIPFSIFIGRLSMTYQDHVLMKWLVSLGCFGMFLLIDLSDLVGTPHYRYNDGHILAVSPRRYILGYFLSYLSIQTFEGVIGSTLSKVIPTTLASGTFNSGLLATLVDTFGRTCGDLFISLSGFINIRQLMNLLFIPGFLILLSCLIIIERCRDLLSV